MPSKQPSAPATQNVTTTQQLPPFLEDAYKNAIGRADSISKEEYVPYTGQRIAGFSAPTQQSFNMTQAGIGQFAPTYGQGVNATASAATPFDSGTFNNFMDPYRQNVTDEIGRLGNRNLTENIMPAINSQFTGNGMFGSSRNAEILGRAGRDAQADITGKQGDYLSSGFQNSMSNYNTAMNRTAAAGQTLANEAQQGQAMYGTDVNALAKVGAAQEGKNQNVLDTAYNEFLAQRDYPKVQTQFYSDIAHGTPTQGLITNTQQGTSTPAYNSLNDLLGTAGFLKSASMKKGGRVKKPVARKLMRPTGLGSMPPMGAM